MILLFILSLINISLADPTWKWSNALKIEERHEFYANNEVISKPKDSWQTLFAVRYLDPNLKEMKDCVYYYVPGTETGILKINTIPGDKKCDEFIFSKSDQEWKKLKAVQFSIQNNLLSVGLTDTDFNAQKWETPLFNVFERPTPKGLMSSAEYRAPKVIFLTPYKGQFNVKPEKAISLADKKLCHDISEDCEERSPSVCSQCDHGWYEMPIGCKQNPKYCGTLKCGLRNRPACRRGMEYQRKQSSYNCRQDTSFAYCEKGLQVHCQGNLPYCL